MFVSTYFYTENTLHITADHKPEFFGSSSLNVYSLFIEVNDHMYERSHDETEEDGVTEKVESENENQKEENDNNPNSDENKA